MKLRALVVALVALCAFSSCGGPSSAPKAKGGAVAQRTPSHPDKPSAYITAPKNGEEVVGAWILVTVSTTIVKLTKPGPLNNAGEGHLIYYVDVEKIPTTPGESALLKDEKHAFATTDTFHYWVVDSGRHELAVQLVNNDNTPLDPPAVDRVAVSYSKGDAAPSSSPAASG